MARNKDDGGAKGSGFEDTGKEDSAVDAVGRAVGDGLAGESDALRENAGNGPKQRTEFT